jgi:AcrR family transcriptional regulator
MRVMSTASTSPYEHGGRTAQKQRTRRALVAAARDLLAHECAPTVEATADAAGISRTTAYRYFPNQRALLVASHPEVDTPSLLPSNPPADAAERLELVVEAVRRVIFDTEAQQRAMLRLSLDAGPHDPSELPLRQGRVIGWVTEALEPVREALGDDELHRLVLAIRTAIGIEALVWLVDVAGLTREEAAAQMRWTTRALYRAAMAGVGHDT